MRAAWRRRVTDRVGLIGPVVVADAIAELKGQDHGTVDRDR